MKNRKKVYSAVLAILLAVFAVLSSQNAEASIYATEIVEGSTAHNWIGGCHGELDASWILGEPDNQLTGWGGGDAGYIVLGFDQLFTDGEGDDLIVHGFGPGTAEVYAALENYDDIEEWTYLGLLGTSRPGVLSEWTYDFADYDDLDKAGYVIINSGSAKFIDAVEAVNPVPVPGAVWLLGSGFVGLIGYKKNKKRI